MGVERRLWTNESLASTSLLNLQNRHDAGLYFRSNFGDSGDYSIRILNTMCPNNLDQCC